MRSILTALSAMVLVGLLLSTGFSGIASAATTNENPLDRIKLEQGTTKDFNGGNYVAVNMTRGDSAAWFGVVYGTKEHPAPPTLVGAYIRYLGGAEVRDANGGMMVPAVPIPVVTVFFQQLDALIEFNDTGYIGEHGARVGADNGLFDFAGNRSLGNFGIYTCEPVYKMVDLKTAWTLSEVTETVDQENSTKHYDFALTANDLTYNKIWDNNPGNRNADGSRTGTGADGVVKKVSFVFHVDATAEQMNTQVPWYEVSVDGNNRIISSKQVESKDYTGISVNAAFKYDHVIEGWNYTAQSGSSKLMLENIVFFGTFIPEIVQKWIDAQFINGQVKDGAGSLNYQAEGSDSASTAAPEQATKVAKNKVEFKDNWQRVGKLEWISNVTVDGQEKTMYYQIHAGDRVSKDTEWFKSKDGEVKGIAVIGGYIYPAGQNIMHDPLFEASSFMINIVGDVNPFVVMLLVFGAVAVCGITVVSVFVLRQRSRRKNQKFDYQIPPEYRKP